MCDIQTQQPSQSGMRWPSILAQLQWEFQADSGAKIRILGELALLDRCFFHTNAPWIVVFVDVPIVPPGKHYKRQPQMAAVGALRL